MRAHAAVAADPSGPVAQGIEQQPSKLKVPGSNPGGVASSFDNLALKLIGTRVSLAAFLFEPFATQFVHFCAMSLIIYGAIRGALGERTDTWASRAR